MRQILWLCTGLALLLLAGCSSMDVITKKQMETETRLEQMLQATTAQSSQLADLSRDIQELKTRMVAQETAMTAMQAGQTALRADLEAARQQPGPAAQTMTPVQPSARISVVNAEPTRADRETQQQEAYMKAFGIFSANRYPEAINAFTAFIAAHPDSEYAANAQYWIGECHYTQKEYQKALEAFSTVLVRYPKGKKVPDAMLKVAFSQLSLNDQASARGTLHKLIDSYPKSPAAAKARERLSRP